MYLLIIPAALMFYLVYILNREFRKELNEKGKPLKNHTNLNILSGFLDKETDNEQRKTMLKYLLYLLLFGLIGGLFALVSII